MPIQAKTVVHIFKSAQAQSQFDFYVQAIEDTYEVKVDGQSTTDFAPQGTANGSGWRIGFSQPVAANTEVVVQFDAKDYMGDPVPPPEPPADPEPDPQPDPSPEPPPAEEPPAEPAPEPDPEPAKEPTES